ncbi:MAG: metallophosphoesterase [Planctomycetes bacterium]|nr:metallophosphoesterase [Planctomycetota bacterium]
MRLLHTSDLHGNVSHYARLVAAAEQLRPNVVVLGGDLLPDDSATDPQSFGHGQAAFVRAPFRKFVTDLKQRSGAAEVFVIFGNHDWGSSTIAMGELADEGLVRILTHTDAANIDGINFIGYSFTPPTPWYVKDYERLDRPGDVPPFIGGARWSHQFSRPVQHGAKMIFDGHPTIKEDMAALKVPAQPWVFVAHAPPFSSKLDQSFSHQSYGSRSIREAIETYQPLLSLHGNIHESPRVSGEWCENIGTTLCVNAGQTTKAVSFAVIEIDEATRRITQREHGQQA